MDIKRRNVEWLTSRFKETFRDYSRWDRFSVEKGTSHIKLSSFDGTILAHFNVDSGSLGTTERYYKAFPFNNSGAAPHERITDFIDLVWYLTSAHGRTIFAKSSGEFDEEARDYLSRRNFQLRLNQATVFLNRYYANNISSSLGGHEYRQLSWVNPQGLASYLFNPEHYAVSKVAMVEKWVPLPYVLENLSYRYYEPSGSWWPTNHFTNSDGIPEGYRSFLPAACRECGTEVPREHLYNGICQHCLGVPPEKIMLHNYSTRANNVIGFKGEKKKVKSNPALEKFTQYYKSIINNLQYEGDDTMYLGIEMEYECHGNREDALVPILRHLHEHVIIKTDGSLRNGVEIVTCPATYEEQVKALGPFFAQYPKDFIYPYNTCGTHIHISRGCLTAGTQGRLLSFMNNPENKDFLVDLAGRFSSQYAGMGNSVRATQILRGGDGNRYRMLNTTNTATLEFRLFKSTDKWEDMLIFMQFVCAIVEYCKPCNTNHNFTEHKKASNFKDWLKDYRKDYPELHAKYYGIKQRIAKAVDYDHQQVSI